MKPLAKVVTERKARDLLLRPGSFMVQQHTPRGPVHFIWPDQVVVPNDAAERIKENPNIVSGADGLFGCAQTWRGISS
jgi:hypothetical protein